MEWRDGAPTRLDWEGNSRRGRARLEHYILLYISRYDYVYVYYYKNIMIEITEYVIEIPDNCLRRRNGNDRMIVMTEYVMEHSYIIILLSCGNGT